MLTTRNGKQPVCFLNWAKASLGRRDVKPPQRMNKSSRYLRFWVLAQVCVIVAVVGWRIYLGPLPTYPIPSTRADIAGQFKVALNYFSNDCGRYPTTAEGFTALINCPTNILSGRWHGPYIDPPKIPQDVWHHDYVYRCPGIHNTNGYDLYSCGYDGISKSGGDDLDDINNWDPLSPHGRIVPFSRGVLEGFQGLSIFSEIMFTLLTIPFIFVIRLIAALSSRCFFEESIAQNLGAHIVWLVISLVVLYIFLASFGPVAGR